MTTMTFDRLAYIDRLKGAGFAEAQARALADGLDQALREEVATKSDIAALRSELRVELGEFKNEVRSELGDVRSELGEVRAELGEFRAELGLVRGELVGQKGELLAAMKADKIDFLKWVVLLIVGQTAVFTALRLLSH